MSSLLVMAHTGTPGAPQQVKFRMPTAENLIPIRLDIEIDGKRLKDAFSWNAEDADAEIIPFAKRLVREQGLPNAFLSSVIHSIQGQLAEFRAFEGQEIAVEERVQLIKLEVRVNNTMVHDQFLWDVNNFDSNPEVFASQLCTDLGIRDPHMAPAVAVAIREQLYEAMKQCVVMGRESRVSKKARRGGPLLPSEFGQSGSQGQLAVNLMQRSNQLISVVRKNSEWDMFEPVVEILTDVEVEALDARDDLAARTKRRQEENDEVLTGGRYFKL